MVLELICGGMSVPGVVVEDTKIAYHAMAAEERFASHAVAKDTKIAHGVGVEVMMSVTTAMGKAQYIATDATAEAN